MAIVTLVSGGLDSTLMSIMAQEEGIQIHPLFIDYGQRAAKVEWTTCQRVFKRSRLPAPARMNLGGFGMLVPSGITSTRRDILADAFLPGRNLLLLLSGAAYAARLNANAVAIGLLDETARLFDDQSKAFLAQAEPILRLATATQVSIRAPLIDLTKKDVLDLARRRNLRGTYSCHAGGTRRCGKCLSCRERQQAEGE